MEPFEIVITSFVAIVIMGFCMCLGCSATDASWAKDCNQMGFHRNGDVVYACHKQERI